MRSIRFLLIGVLAFAGITMYAQVDRDPAQTSVDVPPWTKTIEATASVEDSFLTGLVKENFRLYEDGVPQNITGFRTSQDEPITMCLLIEFSGLHQQYYEVWEQTMMAALTLIGKLKENDYIGIVAYELHPEILLDFTKDKREAAGVVQQRLQMPSGRETNLFDSLGDTLERMSAIKGRKAIVILSSGYDSFSKLTLDDILNVVRKEDTTIYSVGLMQALRQWLDTYGYLDALGRLTYLQADNQLRTFSDETGGVAFFPRHLGELPDNLNYIISVQRSKFVLTYAPTNQARDGSKRKIKVDFIDPRVGKVNKTLNPKKPNKTLNVKIVAKKQYIAPVAE